MCRKSDGWDNSLTESFFNGLKNERYHGTRCATHRGRLRLVGAHCHLLQPETPDGHLPSTQRDDDRFSVWDRYSGSRNPTRWLSAPLIAAPNKFVTVIHSREQPLRGSL